jgi:hypothetical protein
VKAFAALCALLTISCGSGGDVAPTATASGGTPAKTSASAAARASASAASATASAAPTATASGAPAGLTREEFCAQAVKLGEENMAKCASSERANVDSTDRVKDLASAAKECTMRVGSANVDFHPDVAQRCLEGAKKRGGKTTFFTFFLVPECSGVLTGKAADGAPVLFAEECAPGLAMLKNHCSKPVAKNARCDDFPAGLLGKVDEHPRCQDGLACFMTFSTSDGYPSEFACMPPTDLGAPCKLDLNTCAQGSSCYQGKCRAVASEGGECMRETDCAPELTCEIKGGVFGKCVARPPLQTCG